MAGIWCAQFRIISEKLVESFLEIKVKADTFDEALVEIQAFLDEDIFDADKLEKFALFEPNAKDDL